MLTNSDGFETFQFKLRGEFGSRLFAKYKDSDGDLVTIRNERDVKMMYSYAQKVRLTLILYSTRPARDEEEVVVNYKRKDFKKHMEEKREKREREQRERDREREKEKGREKGKEKEKGKGKERDIEKGKKEKRKRCHGTTRSRTNRKRNNANFSTFEVLESFVDAVVSIDHRGAVLFFNGAAEDMFGWEREEILGKSVDLLMNDHDANAHAGYLRKYRQRGKGAIMGKGKKVTAKTKEGRLFDVWLSLSEANVSYTAIIQEIQEGKRVMPSGHASSPSSNVDLGELFSFFDMYAEAVLVTLESGIIQYANKKVYSTFGHENLVGAPASVICPALCSSKVIFFFFFFLVRF